MCPLCVHLGVINGLVHPQIMKVRVEKRKLDDLLKKFELWKQDYAQILQRFDLKLQHSRERQAMLNSEQVGFLVPQMLSLE